MMYRMLTALTLAAAVFAGASLASADELGKKASKVMRDNEKAIVQIEATLTVSAKGPMAERLGGTQEQKVNVQATVIDASGLCVCSYVSLNPTSAMGKINLPGGQGTVSFKGELSDVQITLPDGTDIPARVVLKDEDLDLAFVAPKEKLESQDAEQISAVDLSKPAPKASRLDQVVRLSRLGKSLNRELVVELDRISAIITKPRRIYILGGAKPGSPVFVPGGKLLGIITFRKKPGAQSLRRAGGIGGTPVVLPTSDVKKIADQAREELKKAPATKPKPEKTEPETKKAQD